MEKKKEVVFWSCARRASAHSQMKGARRLAKSCNAGTRTPEIIQLRRNQMRFTVHVTELGLQSQRSVPVSPAEPEDPTVVTQRMHPISIDLLNDHSGTIIPRRISQEASGLVHPRSNWDACTAEHGQGNST